MNSTLRDVINCVSEDRLKVCAQCKESVPSRYGIFFTRDGCFRCLICCDNNQEYLSYILEIRLKELILWKENYYFN